MTYDQTLDFLYSQLPMYQRIGKQAFKKGLGNIKALLVALGNPERTYPCIHVAGTNGKGTVSHMLAACYQSAGLKVGLYTSPHYKDFRERIKTNGSMISKREIVRFVQNMSLEIKRIKPSFFEITVAMAFDAFRHEDVDIAIIETGLGGRLDSTNVITPLLSIITNISFDHMDMLGNTIPQIAREKAGIIKREVPVVIGEWQKESAVVFKKVAARRSAKLSYANKNMNCHISFSALKSKAFNISLKGNLLYKNVILDNSGPFQSKNLVTAIWAMYTLQKTYPELFVSQQQLKAGLKSITELTSYQGRWQVLGTQPLILTDSAHNEAGLAAVFKKLSNYNNGNVHIVIGMVREKDVSKILRFFPVDARYYFCQPNVPRGMDAQELAKYAGALGILGKGYSSVRRALATAKQQAGKDDLIFIGGSSFVVAEVL